MAARRNAAAFTDDDVSIWLSMFTAAKYYLDWEIANPGQTAPSLSAAGACDEFDLAASEANLLLGIGVAHRHQGRAGGASVEHGTQAARTSGSSAAASASASGTDQVLLDSALQAGRAGGTLVEHGTQAARASGSSAAASASASGTDQVLLDSALQAGRAGGTLVEHGTQAARASGSSAAASVHRQQGDVDMEEIRNIVIGCTEHPLVAGLNMQLGLAVADAGVRGSAGGAGGNVAPSTIDQSRTALAQTCMSTFILRDYFQCRVFSLNASFF